MFIAVEDANPHEVTLIGNTPEERFTGQIPELLIGDKTYDGDTLDERLREIDVEMIAPNQSNRKKSRTQDGRKMRQYERRWEIKRLLAWLSDYRRCFVR